MIWTRSDLIKHPHVQFDEDVTIEYEDASEIATKMITGDIDLCMLPVPAVTTVLIKNKESYLMIYCNIKII